MDIETPCKNDLDIIKQQLNCKELFISGIVERCKFGYPRIVLLNPLTNTDGIHEINYQAVANLMWLTCPYLNDKIHELENTGLISRITEFILQDMALQGMMKRAHANFYFLRNVMCLKYAELALTENSAGIFKKGIGGIKNLDTLKCLHIHFCHYRVFKDNVAGNLTSRLLDDKLDCDECACGGQA